jgi:hypothetical protein
MELNVIYIQGGMNEFARTGVYPRSLEVNDVSLNKRWRRKITEAKNTGVLKIGNKVIYSYHVNIEQEEVKIFDHNLNPIENFSVLYAMSD